MSKQKPVWRMNTGRGVPSDLGGRILYSNGLEVWTKSGHWYCPDSWGLFSGVHIHAYQTTRTKAAKHERMECGVCDGDGFYLGENSRVERTCKTCNGKGYRLEAIK